MKTITKIKLVGVNGSRSQVVAEVSGAWNTKRKAEVDLDRECRKLEEEYADGLGMSVDELRKARHNSWLDDYQTVRVEVERL